MQSGEPAKDFLKWIDVDGARLFDFERVESYVTDQYSHFEPGILTILQFLDLADYRDITDLLFARCALEASNPSAVVQLEVTELVDTVEEARALHSQQASLLIDRVNVYNRVLQGSLGIVCVGRKSAMERPPSRRTP
jgi:hypothetical protein